MSEKERLDEELEDLGRELRRLPTPRAPEALVSRVRTLGHLALAERADERLDRLVLGFLLLFSWTMTVFAVFAVRLLTGASVELLGSATGGTLLGPVVYFVFSWISGAAVLVLVGVHVGRERRWA